MADTDAQISVIKARMLIHVITWHKISGKFVETQIATLLWLLNPSRLLPDNVNEF